SKTVSATFNSVEITQTATVEVTAGGVSATQSTVTGTSPITAGSGTSTITVTAKDASGNPIQGATVVLAASGANNALTQPAGPTDANGVATGTLSSTTAGSKVMSATIGGVGVTATATIVVNPGPVSAGQSTLTATSPIAAGTGTSTITVTAKDGFGNPIPGATVALAATGLQNTLTQPSGPTNGDGVATGTLSSTLAESTTISATINAVAITQTATVVVNAGAVSAAQSTVTATSPITASSGSSQSTITVTARDASGWLRQPDPGRPARPDPDRPDEHADATWRPDERQRRGHRDAQLARGRIQDGVGDHQYGRDHADGDRRGDGEHRLGRAFQRGGDVADHGLERGERLDDHGDGAGRAGQSRRGCDGNSVRHGGGQHADAARDGDERERGGDGDAGVDAGRVEDDLGDDQRGRDHADGHGGCERRDRVGEPIDRECHVTDCGGERDVDDHGDGARRER